MRRIALVALVFPCVVANAQQRGSSPSLDYLRQDPSALEDSLMNIPSSSQRASALRRAGQTDDRATLLMIARVARTVPNSTDRARVLGTIAPRYLSHSDRALSDAFFRAVRTIPSSEELRDVLIDVVPYAEKSEIIANSIIEVARIVPSSPDRSDVLAALVVSGAVRTNDVRENFADALREVPGEQDRQRVARAATRNIKQ